MAFIRKRPRKDGGCSYSVVFTYGENQTQTSLTYPNSLESAEKAKKLIEAVGAERAMDILGVERDDQPAAEGMTVTQWLTHYVDHLSGRDRGTITKYRAYIRNDIAPILGDIPLTQLAREDMARWVQWMESSGALNRDGTRRPASAKTIANKHGFISAALAAAVPRYISSNPAADPRLPEGDPREADEDMLFLSHRDFDLLLEATTEYWQPMMEFMVASGCRWGEVSGLRPSDVNRADNTVRIRRAWTYSECSGYRLKKPKGKSRRTINIPARILDKLDYSGEWLFTNSGRGSRNRGGPVRYPNFRHNVWDRAVARAGLNPKPTPHDLRHTCASWMIAQRVPLPTIQAHLGHESITTTIRVYGHLDRTSFAEAAAAVEGILSPSGSLD